MLVLSRKVGERLMLGNNVEIAVIQVRGKKVRLGVTAPRDVPVHRAEVRTRIRDAPSSPWQTMGDAAVATVIQVPCVPGPAVGVAPVVP